MDVFVLRWLLTVLSSLVVRQRAAAIEYSLTENRVLREQLGGRRLKLSDAHRRRLADKGRLLSRAGLTDITTLARPDTILMVIPNVVRPQIRRVDEKNGW